MRNLLYWVALLLLGGCTSGGYYYPGQVPKDCRVSDGYCYHYSIVHNEGGEEQGVVDVYIWTPKDGWKFHHREPRS
jgi:hypothetical protein